MRVKKDESAVRRRLFEAAPHWAERKVDQVTIGYIAQPFNPKGVAMIDAEKNGECCSVIQTQGGWL